MPVRGVAGAAGARPGAAEEEEAWRWTFFCGVSQAVAYAEAEENSDKCRGEKVILFNEKTAAAAERSKERLAAKPPATSQANAKSRRKGPRAKEADKFQHAEKRQLGRAEQTALLEEKGFNPQDLQADIAAARKDPAVLKSEVDAILHGNTHFPVYHPNRDPVLGPDGKQLRLSFPAILEAARPPGASYCGVGGAQARRLASRRPCYHVVR